MSSLDKFISMIKSSANQSIPPVNTKPAHRRVPWWNLECEQTIKAAKHAFHIFRKQPTYDHQLNYKKLRAIARKTIKTSKTKSWKDYVNELNPLIPFKPIWKKIKIIQGSKTSSFTATIVNKDNKIISSILDLTNLLANTFPYNTQ